MPWIFPCSLLITRVLPASVEGSARTPVGAATKSLLLAAMLILPCAAADRASPTELKLQKELLAPCCYRETLDHHMSDASLAMKAEIHAMIERGASERDIVEYYKRQYGSRILAEPEGATWWLAFLIPFGVLGLGALVVLRFIGANLRTAGGAAAVAICAAGLWSCSGNFAAVPEKQHMLHGRIIRLDADAHIAVIAGDRIEGWMEAMTMEYPVKDKAELEKLQPGQEVTATVHVRDTDYWISGIHPSDNAPGK
ncbi:MAG TPA: cytochrome c-type biogenesis protein CcmH [Bryobacteraceae bacterium]|nr:cytochrome c-type biogenesis protein CcmH [Bryobacteraceae bacterium]